MTKVYLSVDSQLLNAIQACSTKAKYQFIEHLQPLKKARALEMGDLMHKCLEIYDGLRGKCANEASETWSSVKEAGLLIGPVEELYNNDLSEITQLAIEAGKLFASRMELSAEDSTSVLYQLKEYCEFYKSDPWTTLAVEEIATKLLYEDDDMQLIYSGKIDRVVEQGRVRAPMDHKTSERRQDPTSLSNQFIGYCWLLETNNIVIDKIGFQKTLKPFERFQRYILTIDDARISEWFENSVASIKEYVLGPLRSNSFPMNLTSCDKYGQCIYAKICEASPEGRKWIKERDYVIGQPWDVAAVLEGK